MKGADFEKARTSRLYNKIPSWFINLAQSLSIRNISQIRYYAIKVGKTKIELLKNKKKWETWSIYFNS